MHGIVHRSLKQYVIERSDDDGWNIVTDVAGIDDDMFLPIAEYPDRDVVAVLDAVADLTDHPRSAVGIDFGRYFVPQMLETFEPLLDREWGAIDVVAALDRLYARAVSKDGDPESVTVVTRRPDPDTVVVEYTADRDLSAMLEGIVRGIGNEYDTDLNVEREAGADPDGPDVVLTVRV
jgi:hypothetical protein